MNRSRLALAAFVCTTAAMAGIAPVAQAKAPGEYVEDARDYVLAPLDWSAHEWAVAGASAAAVGVAFGFDSSVKHSLGFPETVARGDPHSLRDSSGMIALTLGTLAVGVFRGDGATRSTAYDMVEAVALGTASSFALKHAFGRVRPDATNDHGAWFSGGDSFPSGHVTAMFAAAQVFADSRPPEEWGWRVAAYSLGAATAYGRISGNMHWMSDTVAGAALGVATGRFVSNRGQGADSALSYSLQPVKGGAMLSLSVDPYSLLR